MIEGMNMGGCLVSKNILDGKGKVTWCFKGPSAHELDNGRRFLSEIDTEEFLAVAENMVICDWGTIFEIEPAVDLIYDMPVGTEVTLVRRGNKRGMYFVYTETGEKVKFPGYE